MFEAISGVKKLEAINLGSESHFDSKKNTYVLKVVVENLQDVKIPAGYTCIGGEIFTEDLETKICCLELPPMR